jgi:prepilin-type N-terminal cleavage/methylation domain-containing protein
MQGMETVVCGTSRRPAVGFTLVELLVVIAILGLLIGILVPSLGHAQALARRASCASNLKEVGKGCTQFANTARYHREGTLGTLPRTDSVNSTNWGSLSEGNAAALWELVREDIIGPEVLLCPAAKIALDLQTPKLTDGGLRADTYSYSYLSQVGGATALRKARGDLVILADRNPRCTPGTQNIDTTQNGRNSKSHSRDGQNMVTPDGSARWTNTTKPNADDDIYRSDSGDDTQGLRENIDDSFLIP